MTFAICRDLSLTDWDEFSTARHNQSCNICYRAVKGFSFYGGQSWGSPIRKHNGPYCCGSRYCPLNRDHSHINSLHHCELR